MYDISNSDSQYHINKWVKKINDLAINAPTILIGNKKDIESNTKYKINKAELKKECNIINYFAHVNLGRATVCAGTGC